MSKVAYTSLLEREARSLAESYADALLTAVKTKDTASARVLASRIVTLLAWDENDREAPFLGTDAEASR